MAQLYTIKCPKCNYTMCVLDEDFRNHVIQVIYAD